MRPIADTLDLKTLIAKAEATHALLRHHQAECTACGGPTEPIMDSCERGRQLQRQLRAVRALADAARRRSPGR